MSNIVHKVKDAFSKDHHDRDTTSGTTTTSSSNPNYYGSDSTNAGPHSSKIANKADPRVDSDRDGSYTVGSNTGSGMAGMTGTGTGGYGTQSSGFGTHSTTTTGGHGPHSSGMANRADPFVDSTTGTTSHTMGTGTTGYSGSTNAGPHGSNVANKVDPRVDSDRDGSYTMGGNTTTGTGMTGTGMTGTGMTGSTGGYNKTTAGPHKSDTANKLDPRVDSDLDGSRTVGSGPKYGNY
ncbi:hypothetical protein TWF281_002770 [Arthrobotrys megalospora]